MMLTYEDLDELSTSASPQHMTMFPSPTTPVELKIPVPFRPLTIPSVADFMLEDEPSPASENAGSPSTSPPPKPSSSRRSTSHGPRLSRNRGPDHVPRPPNPFILFACHVRTLPGNKGVNNRELSKRAGDLWNELSAIEKEYWRLEAQKAKEIHAQRYPGYRYQPRKRESLSSEKSAEAEGSSKRSARGSSRRRPAPLSLTPEARQPDLLYPADCLAGAIDEFEALQASYPSTSMMMDTLNNYPVLNPSGHYILIPLDHSRGDSRPSLPLSPNILENFQLLSLQSPPVNVQFQGVDLSMAYPSPISPPQGSFNQQFPLLPDAFQTQQQQQPTFYQYQ